MYKIGEREREKISGEKEREHRKRKRRFYFSCKSCLSHLPSKYVNHAVEPKKPESEKREREREKKGERRE